MTTANIITGDCLEVMRGMEPATFDAIVTDPPYGLSKQPDMAEVLRHWLAGDDYRHTGGGFMGKEWDSFVPGPTVWREARRVLKPGGHMLAFFGTRTYDMGVIAIRLAGFEVRDTVGWAYGCLDTDALLVGEQGPKPHTEAKVGELVLCYSPESGEYSYQPILEIVEYEYSDTAFRIEGDSFEQVVSRNHRCIVERDGREVFVTAEEAAQERQARVPILEGLPELREALSGGHQRTGDPQKDVRGVSHCTTSQAAPMEALAPGRTKREPHCLPGLREAGLEAPSMAQEGSPPNLQQQVQRGFAVKGVGETLAQESGGMDGHFARALPGENDRPKQSGMERRGDVLQEEGALCGPVDQARPLPGGVSQHGPQGRVCDGTPAFGGDCDWPPTDPPGVCPPHQSRCDGQQDRKPHAFQDQRGAQTVRAWARHSTHLARITPFHHVGRVWCLRVPTGAFVAVRNGVAFPTGNSGFPKSLDVSKAIDKAAGAEREVVGQGPNASRRPRAGSGVTIHMPAGDPITAPATPEAQQWQGFGTSLKPAFEPIALCRKPLEGTVAANVLKHGAGGLNIDGCRVGDEPGMGWGGGAFAAQSWNEDNCGLGKPGEPTNATGRFPANLLHDGSPESLAVLGHAARFFYCAKASKADRDDGLGGMEEVRRGVGDVRPSGDFGERLGPRADGSERIAPVGRNHHPTVKPTALMRYLCRLVTPPGGHILDPFTGSGSTGRGAVLEGHDFTGIELSAEYADIARARIKAAQESVEPDLFHTTPEAP